MFCAFFGLCLAERTPRKTRTDSENALLAIQITVGFIGEGTMRVDC